MMKSNMLCSGAEGTCHITINDTIYDFGNVKNFEAKETNSIEEIRVLGRTTAVHKNNGSKGTFTCTMYYNQSVLRQVQKTYKETGVMPRVDIHVANEDPSSTVGKQAVILLDCLFDSLVIAKLDVDSTTLTEDLSGTFDDWDMPKSFDLYEGMI